MEAQAESIFGMVQQGKDRVAIESVLISHQIEAVVQLAGSINVGESMKNPGKYFRNNFSISLNLLEAMDASGVNQIVFSSTASVYGIPATSPIDESAAKRPINPYGEAKWFVERLLERHHHRRDRARNPPAQARLQHWSSMSAFLRWYNRRRPTPQSPICHVLRSLGGTRASSVREVMSSW